MHYSTKFLNKKKFAMREAVQTLVCGIWPLVCAHYAFGILVCAVQIFNLCTSWSYEN